MVIECCSQERSYSKFYGLIGERFSKLNRVWTDAFEAAFREYYETIHRYETNRLRNISRFFGHMLATDAVSWAVLDVVHMNEDDTTSSSRIFVKIMFGEVVERRRGGGESSEGSESSSDDVASESSSESSEEESVSDEDESSSMARRCSMMILGAFCAMKSIND